MLKIKQGNNGGNLEERKFSMKDLMNETNYDNLAESHIYAVEAEA